MLACFGGSRYPQRTNAVPKAHSRRKKYEAVDHVKNSMSPSRKDPSDWRLEIEVTSMHAMNYVGCGENRSLLLGDVNCCRGYEGLDKVPGILSYEGFTPIVNTR